MYIKNVYRVDILYKVCRTIMNFVKHVNFVKNFHKSIKGLKNKTI